MTIGIYVRLPDGSLGDELDDFVSLTVVLRWCDVSSWSLELPYNSKSLDFIADVRNGIVLDRYDMTILTGPITQVERSWSDRDRCIVSGLSDDTILWERIAYPSAPTDNGDGSVSFPAEAYDVRSGDMEQVLRDYVQANAITGGAFSSGREVTGLSLAPDLGRGASVHASARFQTLGEIAQAVALADGMYGFGIKNLTFDVITPTDRTDDVIFSRDMGNLASFDYSRTRPQATHFVVGGGGEGTLRTFVVGGDDTTASSWNRRIESFRDRRDTTDIAELQQTILEELADKGEQRGFSVQPIDLPTLSYGRDYFVGDKVTVVVDNTEITDTLRQVQLTYDEKGETVTPSVLTPTAQAAVNTLKIYDGMRRLSRRLSALERNF